MVMISDAANRLLLDFEATLGLESRGGGSGPWYAGVDLGTAYTVTAVVDPKCAPVAGVITRSQSSIRDGVVLDYISAVNILRRQVQTLHDSGFDIRMASAAYPPGISNKDAKVFANVLESAGLEVSGLVEEPTAASLVLGIKDGAVVDIGGGTTGISVLRGGEVIYSADEATGGIHADLVISGHFRINTTEAEKIKTDPSRQAEIFPVLQPVFEKMASIVSYHLTGYPVDVLYLVGGTSSFPGIREVMESETGLAVEIPTKPLLVTPLGIALSCRQTEMRKAVSGE